MFKTLVPSKLEKKIEKIFKKDSDPHLTIELVDLSESAYGLIRSGLEDKYNVYGSVRISVKDDKTYTLHISRRTQNA